MACAGNSPRARWWALSQGSVEDLPLVWDRDRDRSRDGELQILLTKQNQGGLGQLQSKLLLAPSCKHFSQPAWQSCARGGDVQTSRSILEEVTSDTAHQPHAPKGV